MICFYKTSERFPVLAVIVCLIVTSIESGANTYLTSVPTVSRDSYLTNYDSYQIITDRTVANENYDFFRFDKFARRTQNDAMMIDCHGSSYFSSTINSLVSDFYKKYGMKGSRVNYCFDGATPVSAAFLANRYMLYTLDRGYDNVYEFADREGDVYLYKNNYAVPFGFMITETDNTELDSLFVSEEYMWDNIHTSRNEDSDLNPLEKQNKLVHKLGIAEDVFIPVDISLNGSNGDLYIPEDAHYYAYATNTKIDDIELNYEGQSKTFAQINKKFILDLGYHNADKTLNLTSKNGESLDMAAYKMDTAVLDKFITRLREQTLSINSYSETNISASINVTTKGHLVMSVPYEPSWTLYVDGVKTNMDVFENTFISILLDNGEHTIELKYFPKGLIPGAVVSVISIGVFVAICMMQKKKKEPANK